MIRLVSARRLQQLEGRVLAAEAVTTRALQMENHLRVENDLLRQARDFFKTDAVEWKGRASRLIDQIGITSGVLVAPAMSTPAPTPQHETRRVMAALGRTSLSSKADHSEPSDTSARVLGVDEGAAHAAVAGVLT